MANTEVATFFLLGGQKKERIMSRLQSKSVGKLCESTSEQIANKRESSYNKMQKECDMFEAKRPQVMKK